MWVQHEEESQRQTVLFWQMWKNILFECIWLHIFPLAQMEITRHGDTARNICAPAFIILIKWALFVKFRFIDGYMSSYVEPLYHPSNVIPVTKCCTVLWILLLYKERSHENITAPWGNSGIDLSGKSWFSTLHWPDHPRHPTTHSTGVLSYHPILSPPCYLF